MREKIEAAVLEAYRRASEDLVKEPAEGVFNPARRRGIRSNPAAKRMAHTYREWVRKVRAPFFGLPNWKEPA